MSKVIVAFDEEATTEQIELLNKFIEDMAQKGAEVDHLGGGIKNPKP